MSAIPKSTILATSLLSAFSAAQRNGERFWYAVRTPHRIMDYWENHLMRPKEVQTQLGVSAPTLRTWSVQFAQYLSPGAQSSVTEAGTYTQRRYDDSDLVVFRQIQTLLERGLTYEQVDQALTSDPTGEIVEDAPLDVSAAIATNLAIPIPSADDSAIANLRETLASRDLALAAKEQTIQTLTQLVITQQQLIDALHERPEPPLPPSPAVRNHRVDFKGWWRTMWKA
jgi:DNA-binding transcriptional MerR regulator